VTNNFELFPGVDFRRPSGLAARPLAGCVKPIGRRRAPPRRSARRSRAPRPSVATLVTLLSEIRGLVHTELGSIRLDLRRLEQAVGRQSKVQGHDSETLAGVLRQVARISRTLEAVEAPKGVA
jgi:hypothetical protein